MFIIIQYHFSYIRTYKKDIYYYQNFNNTNYKKNEINYFLQNVLEQQYYYQ